MRATKTLSFVKDSLLRFAFRGVLVFILPLSAIPLAGLAATQYAWDAASNRAIAGSGAGSVFDDESAKTDPAVSSVKITALNEAAGITIKFSISGKNLGQKVGDASVMFETKDPAHPVTNVSVLSVSETEIVVQGDVTPNTEITSVAVVVKGKTAKSQGLSISIKPNPPASPTKEFQIKLEPETDTEYPNLHSLVLTKASGDNGVGFDVNANHMSVELEPPGATDLKILPQNESQMVINFVATATYEPKSAIVTVYDSGDLDKRSVKFMAKASAPPSDPDEPKINSVETVYILRSQGIGRLRILGKGFGEYEAPPYSVDDYLLTCLEKAPLMGTDPDRPDVQQKENNAKVEKAADCETLTGKPDKWPKWQVDNVRGKISVNINSRNEDIRPLRTVVINANDALIDVYFEFQSQRGYSLPFRLASADVIIKKSPTKTTQTIKGEKNTATVSGPAEKAYVLSQGVGPTADATLTYSFNVLDKRSANILLGRGISDNFYVVKVSVVNTGTKKVSVPLAAMQAEIEWARGHDIKNNTNYGENGGAKSLKISYVEGPPTMAPIPLAAVSSYFSTYNLTRGRRTIMFNILDGITTLTAAIVPFAGVGLKDAHAVYTGGLIPGLHQVFGDMSNMQLQNLTGLSWQTTETLSPGGGTAEKFIYFLNHDQFESKRVTTDGQDRKTRKQMTNIVGLEVTGFDVNEGDTKQATASGTKSTPGSATAPAKSSSGASGDAKSSNK